MFDYAAALTACARGDGIALRQLYDEEASRLISVAQRIVRRRELAEEVVHDAFVHIWQKAGMFDPSRGSARAWIYTVVRNRALNLVRDGARLDLLDPDALAASSTAASMRRGNGRSGFWRGFAAASVIAAIAIGAAWNVLAPPAPRLIVVLLDSNAKPVSIVETYAGQRVRIVPLDHIRVPENRTLQVWTLPDPATGPVSIGLIPPTGATTLEGPSLPTPKVDQLYEITLEPAGGSPTGRPTGPIIGKGFARSPQI